MTKRILGISTVLAIVPLVTVIAGPAEASCAVPPPLKTAINLAPYVFVGTVTTLENSDRWATVQVEEVWKGEDIPAEVEVRAGPKDPPGPISSASSVDRDFELSKRYLFFPYERNGSIFNDNACTKTSVFKPRFEQFAPVSADLSPSPTTEETVGPPLALDPKKDDAPKMMILGVVAAALLLGAFWFIFQRARRSS